MFRVDARCREGCGGREWRAIAIILSISLFLTVPADRATAQDVEKQDISPPAPSPEERPEPAEQVLLHLQFDGLDAHANAWRKSAAYRLINETRLGSLLEEVILQGVELFEDSRARTSDSWRGRIECD